MTQFVWLNGNDVPTTDWADYGQYDYEAICEAAGIDPGDEEYSLSVTTEDSAYGPAGTVMLLSMVEDGHSFWVLGEGEFLNEMDPYPGYSA